MPHRWEVAPPGLDLWSFSSNPSAQATQAASVIAGVHQFWLIVGGIWGTFEKYRFLSVTPDLWDPNLQRWFLFFKFSLIEMIITKVRIRLPLGWGQREIDHIVAVFLSLTYFIQCKTLKVHARSFLNRRMLGPHPLEILLGLV